MDKKPKTVRVLTSKGYELIWDVAPLENGSKLRNLRARWRLRGMPPLFPPLGPEEFGEKIAEAEKEAARITAIIP